MKLSKKLSALSFAHLLGIGATRADDDEESKSKAKKAEEDDEKDKKDAKKAKKAEGDDGDDEKDDKDAKKAEDGDDPDQDDEKKGRKSKKAEYDDDEGDKEKAARTSERARCAAIFHCASANNRPDLAAHMAFNTNMNSADAIAMLNAAAAGSPKQSSLASRMNSVKTQNPGADDVVPPAASSAQGVAARIIAAGKARRGEA